MKKINRIILFLVLALSANSFTVKASHVAGADISYQHIGGDTFLVTLNVFRDCEGISVGTAQTVTFESSCGQFTVSLPLINPPTGVEVSQLCPSQLIQSTCQNGTLPGMQMWIYQATVVITPPCNDWNMYWTTCCRNIEVDNIVGPANEGMYINATLNSQSYPTNNSPTFTSQPIPYVCANQLVNYSFGVVEIDGDSLVYSLTPALDDAPLGQPLNYVAPYSAIDPITGITIDPVTGLLTFTPTVQGNFTVVVTVDEYDPATGQLISTVRRDIQFVVIACPNSVPNPNAGQITGLTGQGVQTGPFGIELCEGNCFTFNATYDDPDPTDTLIIQGNIDSVLVGVTWSTSGTNPVTLTVNWCAPQGSAGSNSTFSVMINDGSCPVPGLQTFVYDINVTESTVAGPSDTLTICGNQTAQIIATGGTIFNWFDMSGNPVTVGPAFSCNPCATPTAKPAVTTSYVVVSNLSTTCINTDTITVEVVPDAVITATQSVTIACSQQTVQYGLNVSPGNTSDYTILWTPPTNLNSATIPNPVGTYNAAGVYTYIVTATSPLGCVKQDTVSVTVVAAVAPDVLAYSDLTCVGDTAELHMTVTNAVPSSCGITNAPCLGQSFTAVSGTGTASNAATVFPAPYSNWYKNAKHHFLYSAADLNAQGFPGGKITGISFENVNLNTSTLLYRNYTIRMKCTNLTDLGLFFDTAGLVTVYTPKDFTVGLGWSYHAFDNFYEWDGASNILIEICFDNLIDPTYTQSVSSTYTVKPYSCAQYVFSDIDPMCPYSSTNFPTSSNNLPNTKFEYCGATPNPTDYTITWSPTPPELLLNDIFNPLLLPGGQTTYTVTVVNNAGGCSDTAVVTAQYTNQFNAVITSTDTLFCATDLPVTLTATPVGGDWSGPNITPGGVFDPSAGLGVYHIVYQIGQGTTCFDSTSVNLEVLPPPDASIVPPSITSFCPFDQGISLTGVVPGGTWNGPNGSVLPSGLFSPSVAGSGTHLITYEFNNPCFDRDTIVLIVNDAPVFSINPAGPFCSTAPDFDLEFTVTSGIGMNVDWTGAGIIDTTSGLFSPTAVGPGTYQIAVSMLDVNTLCPAYDTITIVVSAPPDPSFTFPNDTLCQSALAMSLDPVVSGGTFTGSTGNSGIAGDTLFNPSLASLGANFIQYTVSNLGCSSTSAPQQIFIIETPPPPSASQILMQCIGTPLASGAVTGNGSGTLLWYLDQALTVLINSGNVLNANAPNQITGNVTVYVVDSISGGCVSAATPVSITFYNNPTASITTAPSPAVGQIPLDVAFTGVFSSDVTEWTWNFGDSTAIDSVAANPQHTYDTDGYYTVLLTVYNANGCMDTATVTVEANEETIIPNIFTPGEGNTNNKFRFQIDEKQLTSFKATIMDRWGKKVVEFGSVNDTWDGGDYPAGTYYYVIEATRKDGKPMEKTHGFFKMMK